MVRIYILQICAAFIVFVHGCIATNNTITLELCTDKDAALTTVLGSRKAYSTVECGAQCFDFQQCKAAVYDKYDEMCILSDEIQISRQCERMSDNAHVDSLFLQHYCLNGASFVSGKCQCAAGYQGVLCENTFVASCPNSYVNDRGICFKYFTENKTYADANSNCKQDGGHLLTIPNSAVRDHLITCCGLATHVWIDGKDGKNHNGQALPWAEWYKKPNSGENCVSLCQELKKMQPFDCGKNYPFLCQIDF